MKTSNEDFLANSAIITDKNFTRYNEHCTGSRSGLIN